MKWFRKRQTSNACNLLNENYNLRCQLYEQEIIIDALTTTLRKEKERNSILCRQLNECQAEMSDA